MQITADISKILKNVQYDLTFIFDVLSESGIGFVSFLIFLALENVVTFTKTCFYRTMRNYAELCGNVSCQRRPQFGIKVFDKIFVL